jgi:CBS domain-containing protein
VEVVSVRSGGRVGVHRGCLLGGPAHDRTGAAGTREARRSRPATDPTLPTVAPSNPPFEGHLTRHRGAVQPFAGRPGPASVETTSGTLLRGEDTMRRIVQDVMTREVVAVRGPAPFKELVRLLNEHRVTAVPAPLG